MLRPLPILLLTMVLLGAGPVLIMAQRTPASIHRWGVIEQTLTSTHSYAHPLLDATLTVELTAPSGRMHTIEGFWDGERTWRFRFGPGEMGQWTWRSQCSDTTNAGLHGQRGSFSCTAYAGNNPFYQHGPLRIAANGTSFAHADGTPFLWIGDTAWNGPLRASAADWEAYLTRRAGQQFTAIQFVSTQWRGATTVLPKLPFTYANKILDIHPDVFRELDAKVNAIWAKGMLAVPVMLWALRPTDPGQALPAADAVKLARYLMARWGAGPCVWFLGGDGRFDGAARDHWISIGRGVFDDRHDQLATLHPIGRAWPHDDFWDEPWFQFAGYQTGHRPDDGHFRWLTEGPPAQRWRRQPARPVVNVEPQYENNASGGAASFHARQHCYWSMLVTPTAGVSFGAGPIWAWNPTEAMPAEGHGARPVPVWREGLNTEGVRSMTHLAQFFRTGSWPQLRPAPERLREQPGTERGSHFIAVSQTSDAAWMVAYVPQGSQTPVRLTALPSGLRARWYNPRTGEFLLIRRYAPANPVFTAPDSADWVLDLRR